MRLSAVPLLAALGFAVSSSAAGSLQIEHSAVGCIVAERYPRIEARLDPVDSVGRARVFFRAAGTSDWYFVDMKHQGSLFQATLPKPGKQTQAIEYYVQALDTALGETQTPEYRPAVVAGAEACRKDVTVAAALASAKVAVGAPAGAPAIPAGFANAGVTTLAGTSGAAGAAAAAAGGGISTGVLVGVLGAGAAVAGGVAVAGGGGDEASGATSGGSTGGSSGGTSGGGAPGGGATAIRLNVTVTSPGSTPHIDVSECAGTSLTFGGGPITLASDGSFNETWSQLSPNTLRLQGRADAGSFQAALSCAARSGPTGQMSASGSNYNMSGTFSFGSQQGTLTVARQQ
jgi:hypothetical protein